MTVKPSQPAADVRLLNFKILSSFFIPMLFFLILDHSSVPDADRGEKVKTSLPNSLNLRVKRPH